LQLCFLDHIEPLERTFILHVSSKLHICDNVNMFQALSDCLAAESKSVEAKLQVLTAALSFYTDLRPNYESGAPEADALGHYLFMYV